MARTTTTCWASYSGSTRSRSPSSPTRACSEPARSRRAATIIRCIRPSRKGMTMDLSIIYELETNDNSEEGIKRRYDECLEEVKLADTLGFKTVWFTEHHFL